MRFLKNERGATSFYAIWMLMLMGVLMVLIMNVVKIYVGKEQAANSAQQACYAATFEIYEMVNEVIDEYDKVGNGGILHKAKHKKTVRQEIKEEMNNIRANHSGFSSGKVEREAIDNVLSNELSGHHLFNGKLKEMIRNKLWSSRVEIKTIVGQMVIKNGGEKSKTVITLFNADEQIEIKTVAKFETDDSGEIFKGDTYEVPQKAMGPEIEFISELGWLNQTLDYKP